MATKTPSRYEVHATVLGSRTYFLLSYLIGTTRHVYPVPFRDRAQAARQGKEIVAGNGVGNVVA